MKIKNCTKCNTEKTLDCFYKQRRKDKITYRSICKACCSASSKSHYQKNSEDIKKKASEYRQNNPETIKEWREKNKEHLLQYDKEYREQNREQRIAYTKEWKKRNKSKVIAYRRKYSEKYYQIPEVKLRRNVSSHIRKALAKDGSCADYLPFTIPELKKHLEEQFTEGMTWDNYGEWHIDHIVPAAWFSATSVDSEEFRRCWSLDNLQPLWASENISKGSTYDGKRHYYER